MSHQINRRVFLGSTLAGYVGATCIPSSLAATPGIQIVSPGAVRSRVRIGLVFLGKPEAHWPTPTMNMAAEVESYRQYLKTDQAFEDVEFVGDIVATTPQELSGVLPALNDVDGLLVIHISMGIRDTLAELLKLNKPTVLFAQPYSGHEWSGFGRLMQQPEGALLDCILSSDRTRIAEAIRPFRAIHHMREARILDVTTKEIPADFKAGVALKFGTEILRVSREEVMAAYDSIDDTRAKTEARHLIARATRIVEPARDEIERSCKLALAFEKLVAEHEATAITVDCYGSMYRQLPAFPCVGFTRLNDMGLAGICESDLGAGLTFMLLQSLSGKPGFISDPTIDESTNGIILAHCLGSTRMDGPEGHACPFKLRSIMERQEGAVMQVKMDKGQKVTQAELVGTEKLLYFTGTIIDTPETERGCRTKVTVEVDGSAQALWHNWTAGLHRVTCYGDHVENLRRFCRFKSIALVNEAVPVVA